MAKIITVYFSHKGENYSNGKMVELKKGNTELAAEYIHNAVGGDIFEVLPLNDYSDNYKECVQRAKEEHSSNERVAIKSFPDNLESYDTIFLGYPNWCGTMPMVMFTLLEKYDLQGKKIIPFCSNEGSGMGISEQDLKKICTGAEISDGLSIHGTDTEKLKDTITEWAKKSI